MLVLLIALTFVYHTGQGIYQLLQVDAAPSFEFLYRIALTCGVVWWLRADAKSSGVKALYCDGLLVTAGWVIILPYHLLKTRGLKGFIPLLALLAALIASQVVATVVYAVFFAQF